MAITYINSEAHETEKSVGIFGASPVPVSYLQELGDWIGKHESDIACGINDFGELRNAWKLFFSRNPKK